jgi:uncharacterized protein (TIGR03083 family)
MVQFPREQEFLDERKALLATLDSLTDAEFDSASTLCEGWAPRDVLAHLLGIDSSLRTYATSLGRINRANDQIVTAARSRSRQDLMAEARRWADSAALTTRPLSWFYLGDLAVHHQDILRGLGRQRPIPLVIRDALLREGATLGAMKLARYRVVPTDGGRPMGRGRVVRGSSEVLALWLTGRKGLEGELTFVE